MAKRIPTWRVNFRGGIDVTTERGNRVTVFDHPVANAGLAVDPDNGYDTTPGFIADIVTVLNREMPHGKIRKHGAR